MKIGLIDVDGHHFLSNKLIYYGSGRVWENYRKSG